MRGIDINGFGLGATMTKKKKKKINNRDVSFEGSPTNNNNNNEEQVHGSGSLVCKDVGGHTMREEGGRSSTMSRGCLLEGDDEGDKQPSIGLTPFRSF